ncbi:MAG: hypothetical protein ACI4QT_07115 [Kiritimatiellia bacterium]
MVMENGKQYEDFVEKFKVKKTTDDCYTPPAVYDVIAAWVRDRYGIGPSVKFVRPFYPGGDFERHDYPSGCVVVDNPPFSITSKIIRFYTERKIPFFLFTDTRYCFYYLKDPVCSVVVTGNYIVYENGAKIRTSFLTNMAPGIMFECAPDLGKRLRACFPECKKQKKNIIDFHFVSGIDADNAARKGLSIRVQRMLSRIQRNDIYGNHVIVRGDIAEAVNKAKAKHVDQYVYLTKVTSPDDVASIEELDESIGVVDPPEMRFME